MTSPVGLAPSNDVDEEIPPGLYPYDVSVCHPSLFTHIYAPCDLVSVLHWQTDNLGELGYDQLQQRLRWLDVKYKRDQEELSQLYVSTRTALEAAARAFSK